MTQSGSRVVAVDLLRGLVMVLMVIDHLREFFFLHAQVTDPVDLAVTSPALALTRFASHPCAPVFVFLAGMSAWLSGQKQGGDRRSIAAHLVKRGLLLVILEVTVVNFAWTFAFPPTTLYLQVIWAIGLSMLALAGLVWLPGGALLAVSLAIVAGHGLLSGVRVGPESPWHALWAVLHQRDWIALADGLRLRTSYPVLPWIGVIGLGYAFAPAYLRRTPAARRALCLRLGLACLAGFAVLRAWNGYGEPRPWTAFPDALTTAVSFLNLTKYPPSLDFVLATLGLGLCALAWLERLPARGAAVLQTLGGAPMFFYLLHLYALHLAYWLALHAFGTNHGERFGFDAAWQLWAAWLPTVALLYGPTRRFAALRRTGRHPWMRYL
ncbi:DUF1624 domain-containing protein [Ralstonia nicotianae]|nr:MULTISPECIES: DUF1624 domain-containing protein [Ralstonia]AKZ25616.1 membrane protein [Ralstonia solanacearum]APF86012.1 hypothetical protein BCR16_04015 [Ralstonia solanacearum FJAT-1458]ARS57069.1 hypothetical protein BC427_13635 [Ralstonia solanacearum FJAT-91]ESS49182.1 hypothetical protein L665_02057 [Ralstonia solanacearum SD54]AOE90574.1 hypothetical protein LBM341_02302 [Ralstonia solanacearum]